jgi:hypothetical protein
VKPVVFPLALITMQPIFMISVDPQPVLLHLLFLEYSKEIATTTKVAVEAKEVVVAKILKKEIEDLGIIILEIH